MKTVLVTGAAGFIGSHVAEALLDRGDAVIGIDDLNDYYPVKNKKRNLEILKKHASFTFHRVDITDEKALADVFLHNTITHIAHLAARAGVRPSIAQPKLYQKVNIEGALNLLELAVQHKIANVVLTSSSSVYGNSMAVPFKEDDHATAKPISPYAATKKACEVLGHTYHHLHGLNVTVIRPFTVYGPRGRPDMAPWLFLEAALAGKPIKRFGDGTTKRDYTYIGDFVSGFTNAIDRRLGYEVINLGNSRTVALNEFIEIVSKVTGEEIQVEEHPMQPGDVTITNADISKARRLLDYDPRTSFAEGMKEFYEWFILEK
jgi:UDP-glucuronate 4-epimerase